MTTTTDLPAAGNAFGTANRHALATILEASETQRIIAATDIFDLGGTKLWARDQPVSAALQRKLLDRQLRRPLESCLVAEDGVSPLTLRQALDGLLNGDPGGGGDSPLLPLLRPHAARLAREVAQLPLHPVAQLLLTAARAARHATFDHAVAAMALNGALVVGAGGDTPEIRLAMLCGLLHDLGEMYVDPHFGEADVEHGDLDVASYRQLVVHPHIGSLLIRQLTDYPAAVARAVAEHHERLDGSGYPHALHGGAVSPQGRLLAVTEAALNAVRGGASDNLLHASVALRAVPGEFDLHWVGQVSRAAAAQPPQPPAMEAADIQARLAALDQVLGTAESQVLRMSQTVARAGTPALRNALELSQFLLGRLRAGWNESGMWSPRAIAAADAAEVEAVEDELYFRLRGVQRAALLRAGPLPPDEAAALGALCDSFAMG